MLRTTLLLASFLLLFLCAFSADIDTARAHRLLIIPYQPNMHLSDADVDISIYSEMDLSKLRREFREKLMKNLQSRINTVYESKVLQDDFVGEDQDELENTYRSLFYQKDTIWPVSHPQKDTLMLQKKLFNSKEKKPAPSDKTYINVGFHDQLLLPELSRKYDVDLIVFLNEFDIKTNYNLRLDKEKEIYAREIKVHYSVFDRAGKQVYGDVASSQYPSNVNEIDEIISINFPGLSEYILASLKNK